jgi:hypothetical protein
MQRAAYGCVFLAWVFPRIIPLFLYPGVFSSDTWIHIGYTEAILVQNHIPFLNPMRYSYFYMPLLHIFGILIHQFLGLSLIDSFRLIAGILVIAGFLAFFTLFRCILGLGWSSLIAMLIFSVDLDVVAQTNSAIAEHFALVFLALILTCAIRLITRNGRRREWALMLALLVPVLAVGHHLTSYFGLLFSISLLIASVLSRAPIVRKFGIIISVVLTSSLGVILILTNPVMLGYYRKYFLILNSVLVLIGVFSILLYFGREWVWRLLESLNHRWARILFTFLGCIAGIVFFAATLLFYPYERTWLWIALKFGFLSCLIGLSLAALRFLPWANLKPSMLGLYIAVSIITVGLSFCYTGLLTLVYAAVGGSGFEIAIGHRHFAFFIIPFSISSALALQRLYRKHTTWTRFSNKLVLPGIILLLLTFSAGGLYNLYYPAGGWYPEYCNHAEIASGQWLHSSAEFNSVIVTDIRLDRMIQSTFPMGTTRFLIFHLTPELLASPRLILNETDVEQNTVYFMISDLMETATITGYLDEPIALECTDSLDRASSLARIYTRSGATIYCMVSR